jgi:hypothetical protein
MKALLLMASVGSFGAGFFDVDPSATVLSYQQTDQALVIDGTDLIGGTLGGRFSTPLNLSSLEELRLVATTSGAQGTSFFTIELYSGEDLRLVAVYEGSTGDQTTSSGIPLTLLEMGDGDLAEVAGLQFTWVGTGIPVRLSLSSLKGVPRTDLNLQRLADEALSLLSSGVAWSGLSDDQRSAYSNVYPSDAVRIAGAQALDLIDQSKLTPELVSGYVNFGGQWKTQAVPHGQVDSSTLMNFSGSWPGWGSEFPVVRVEDPTMPAEQVGSVRVVAVTSGGRLRGYYYTASLSSGVTGASMSGSSSDFGVGFRSVSFSGEGIRVVRPW